MRAYLKEVDEKEFEDKLNEIYGEVDICGLKYSAGWALRQVDEIAFNCAMADELWIWVCDECLSEYETEIEANECCKE
jgi:hypothetical protein